MDRAHTKGRGLADDVGIRELPSPTWQPIETAPKDGTRFLAYTAEDGVDFFHWQDFGPNSDAPRGWRDSFICVYPEGSANGPNHWMPLPPRPLGSGQNLADATQNPPSMEGR